MKEITIENVGPIKHLTIPCPEEGGVVCLVGSNGTGKSTALRAIGALAGGNDQIPKRDGAEQATVDGFGAVLRLKRSQRRAGELECHSLQGRLDIGDLVDPGIADPAAADAKRIRSLIQLGGAKADIELFQPLFSGPSEFFQAVGEVAEEDASDLVALAGKVKRAVQASARTLEQAAEAATNRAKGLTQAAGQVHADPIDPAKANAALEDAIRLESALKSNLISGHSALKAAEDAKAALAKSSDLVSSVADATKARDVAALRLRKAQEEMQEAQAAMDNANADLRESQRHEANVAQLRAIIDKGSSAKVPTEAEIAQVVADVAAWRERIRIETLRAKGAKDQAEAKKLDAEAKAKSTKAAHFRRAAERTDEILTEAVGKLKSPLWVRDGRLMLKTDRGDELFSDLSNGERWRVVLDIAIGFMGPQDVLTVNQEAWEGLQPAKRREVHALAVERKVPIYTARATDDEEIRAEVFQSQE